MWPGYRVPFQYRCGLLAGSVRLGKRRPTEAHSQWSRDYRNEDPERDEDADDADNPGRENAVANRRQTSSSSGAGGWRPNTTRLLLLYPLRPKSRRLRPNLIP